MPQVDLKYANTLTLDTTAIFEAVEQCITTLDSSAGICKSRAYPAPAFLHEHVYLSVLLLKKPHRDKAFMQHCLTELKNALTPFLPKQIHYAIHLDFSSDYYLTK